MDGKFSVAIISDYGYGCDTIPVAVEVDHPTARSIEKHYRKVLRDKWSDRSQMGLYVMAIHTTYCTNHREFEKLSVEYPTMLPDFIRQAYCKEVIA